jgi:hypothetical protein
MDLLRSSHKQNKELPLVLSFKPLEYARPVQPDGCGGAASGTTGCLICWGDGVRSPVVGRAGGLPDALRMGTACW